MIKIDDVIDQVGDFPTLPTIYSSLLEVMANSRSTVHDVANIIAQDQASSTKILKTVNSSIYGIQGRIDTISDAIFHIGFNEVKNLVTSLAIVKMFSKMDSLSRFNIVEFWKHSLAVGVITRILGKINNVNNLENYFIAGIIHDIGKLFFLKSFPDEYTKIINYTSLNEITLREAEMKVFGVSHTNAGYLLAKKWMLPQSITNSIKEHHTGVVNGRFDLQVACVSIANVIAKTLDLGYSGYEIVPQPNFELWDNLVLPNNVLINNIKKIVLDYEQSVSILLVN